MVKRNHEYNSSFCILLNEKKNLRTCDLNQNHFFQGGQGLSFLQCFECRVLYQNSGNRRASTPTSELKGIVEEETEESEHARSKTGETVNEANEKEEIVACKD